MAKISDATFTGQSGAKYKFFVYPMDQEFKVTGGVYTVTRRYKNSNDGYSHEIIYVGETADLSTRIQRPP